uniref:Uncharacterized protein n=1 Tax=Strongyloides papillosus TaxID=174720 RepID=A0A0N5BCG4_STREA
MVNTNSRPNQQVTGTTTIEGTSKEIKTEAEMIRQVDSKRKKRNNNLLSLMVAQITEMQRSQDMYQRQMLELTTTTNDITSTQLPISQIATSQAIINPEQIITIKPERNQTSACVNMQ